jgi:hypothetical protein
MGVEAMGIGKKDKPSFRADPLRRRLKFVHKEKRLKTFGCALYAQKTATDLFHLSPRRYMT